MTEKIKSSKTKKASRLVSIMDEKKKDYRVVLENHPEALEWIEKNRKAKNQANYPQRGNGIFLYASAPNTQKLYDAVDAKFEFDKYE